MLRSFGGTSFTTWPSIRISAPLMSSSPAIIRSVVLLPQPDGPTSTTNCLSEISRSIPRTAGVPSKFFSSERSVTWAIASAFGCAGGQPGDVVVHEECVDEQRRRRAQQRAGHDLSPGEHVAADQRGDDPDRKHELVGRGRERERVEELRPRDGECE